MTTSSRISTILQSKCRCRVAAEVWFGVNLGVRYGVIPLLHHQLGLDSGIEISVALLCDSDTCIETFNGTK